MVKISYLRNGMERTKNTGKVGLIPWRHEAVRIWTHLKIEGKEIKGFNKGRAPGSHPPPNK